MANGDEGAWSLSAALPFLFWEKICLSFSFRFRVELTALVFGR